MMVSGDPWDRERGTDRNSARRAGLDEIAREIERLESHLRPPPPPRPEPARDIDRLAAKVGALADKLKATERDARLPRSRPAPPATDQRLGLLADTVREIEERAAALARDGVPRAAGRSEPSIQDTERGSTERTLRELRSRLDALRPAMPKPIGLSAESSDAELRAAAERSLRAAIAEISARQEAIDRAISPSHAPPMPRPVESSGPPAIDLKNEIGRLSDALAILLRREEADSQTLGRVDERINALARARLTESGELSAMREEIARLSIGLEATAREATLASVEAGYNHLIERLDRLTRDLQDTPLAALPGEFDRLIARVDDLAQSLPERERLNDLAVGVAQLGRAVAAREVGTDLSGLEARLNEIGEAIERLQQHSGRGVDEMSSNLEERLADLAGRIDRGFASMANGDRVDEVLHRLENVAARLDRASHIDDNPYAALDGMRAEIGALRSAMAGAGRPEAEALENQVRALIMRLDAGPGESEPAIAQLEAQIARIADKLDQIGAKPAAYAQVGENLDRLEGLLRSNQRDSVAAARDAARAAVSELSSAQLGDNAAVRSLKEELRRLQAAAESTDNRTQDTLDTVQGALEKVVSRLAALETEGPAMSARPAPRVEETNTSRWRSVIRKDDREPAAPAAPEVSIADRGGDRKADFIAAARRAAQAAAAESASMKNEPEGERKPGPLGRLGQALKARRRPLLLAAAAVVLTIAAIRLYGSVSDGSIAIARSAPPVAAETLARPEKAKEAVSTERVASTSVRDAVSPPVKAEGMSERSDIAFASPTSVTTRFGEETPPAGNFAPLTLASTATTTTIDTAAASAPATRSLPAAGGAPAPALSALPPPEAAITSPTLRAAAIAGDAVALYEIAIRYTDGRDVQQNPKLAAEWFKRSAERGLAIAEFRFATVLERGEGITKDRKAARGWYMKAAEQGNVRAMHNLAVIISEGVDAGPDYGEAADWFQKAADHGVKDSQYNLGVIFARGLGRKQDLVQSYKWFALSAAQGDTDAGGRRDEVAKALTPDQLAQARVAVQAWRVIPTIEAANHEPVPDPSWAMAPEKRTALDRQGLIKKVQSLLSERGYDPGPADGYPGAKTKAAVKAFQARAGIPASGEIDPSLVAALNEKQG